MADEVEKRITHGRHCTCSACAQQDWTLPDGRTVTCPNRGTQCPARLCFWCPTLLYLKKRRAWLERDWQRYRQLTERGY